MNATSQANVLEMGGDGSIYSGQESTDPKLDAAWKAFREHGRAGVGRPRKDSKIPTLAQLGFTKWEARRAQALAAANLSDEQIADMSKGRRGHSLTALLEHNSRGGRRRNPLFRAWRVAMQSERMEFMEALKQLAFFTEREDALSQVGDDAK